MNCVSACCHALTTLPAPDATARVSDNVIIIRSGSATVPRHKQVRTLMGAPAGA